MKTKIDQIKELRYLGYSLKEAHAIICKNMKMYPINRQKALYNNNQNKINNLYQYYIVPNCKDNHIDIICKNCNASGFTKNIQFIGARTLFISCNCGNFEPIISEKYITNNIV